MNADAQFDKPPGFGVHFASSQRRLVRRPLRETRAVLVRYAIRFARKQCQAAAIATSIGVCGSCSSWTARQGE